LRAQIVRLGIEAVQPLEKLQKLSAVGSTRDATLVKNGAGRRYELQDYSAANAFAILKLCNKATVPSFQICPENSALLPSM